MKSVECEIKVKDSHGAMGQGACLKSILRTITIQSFILTAITAAEKCTIILDSK